MSRRSGYRFADKDMRQLMQVGSTLPAGPGAACTAGHRLAPEAARINPRRTVDIHLRHMVKTWMPGTRVYTRAGPDPGAGHDAAIRCERNLDSLSALVCVPSRREKTPNAVRG